MPLVWSEVHKPDAGCCYTHVIAETPLGKIIIDWKGWKQNDTPSCALPWGEFVFGSDLDEAKAAVQAAWNKMAATVAVLSS